MIIAERLHIWLTALIGVLPILLPLGVLVALLAPPATLVKLLLVSFGLQTFFLDIGTTITLPRILAPLALLAFVLHDPQSLRRAWQQYPGRELLILYLLFLAASIILNLPFLPEKDIQTTVAPVNDILLRGRVGRGLTQWIVFALRSATPLLLLAALPTREIAKKLLKLWIIVTTVVCLYGVYQVSAYYMDLPAIYIYRGFNDPTGEDPGSFALQTEERVFRISSLVGEPRDLAAVLLPMTVFLGVLVAQKRQGDLSTLFGRYTGRLLWGVFLLHAATFLLTFSTSGWVAALLAVPWLIWMLRKTTSVWRLGTLVATAALGAALLAVLVPHVSQVLELRLLGRLSQIVLEDPTYGIPQLLHMNRTWPHTLFLGASLGGTLLYEDFLASEIGIIHYVGEIGILGIVLFAAFLQRAFSAINAQAFQEHTSLDPIRVALGAAVLTSIVSLLAFSTPEAISALWVFLGFGAAFAATTPSYHARGQRQGR
jgi:hypothetical protein